MLIFPCRVWAKTVEEAQEKIVVMMLKRGLSPMGLPKPKAAPVQSRIDEIWWECYCSCEEVG